MDNMIQSDKKCSLYWTTKYRIGHPLSDQALRVSDAWVELLPTKYSNDGADGTITRKEMLQLEGTKLEEK